MSMILVTGCARSGTSLTMGVLQACGANLGPTDSLNENHGIRERILKPYLQKMGFDPRGQFPLPDLEDIKPYPKLREHVEGVFPEGGAAKIIKGVLFWPLWVEHFPDAKWVIVWRDPADIARSCMNTHFMTAYKTHDQWEAWARKYHRRCEELRQHADTITVRPHDAISNPEVYRPVVEYCGLEWDAEAVPRVISPGKWHA